MSTLDEDIILPDVFQRRDASEAVRDSDELSESGSDYISLHTTTTDSDPGEPMDEDTSLYSDTKKLAIDDLGYFTGIFRLLDLITEQGSGGTFDKIIIDQASLEAFINEICPGAYKSLTKVDFKKLDRWNIRPIGVYGNDLEITKFLVTLGAVSSERVDNLKSLRPGLYLVKPQDDPTKYYVFYWPEPNTWRDDAIASIVRNRVTFMRYLTKMTDQTICLLSDAEAKAMVWSDDTMNVVDMDDAEDENYHRIFTFEVSKTQDQEENVTSTPGFNMHCAKITKTEVPRDALLNTYLPRLLCGETAQAFYTLTYEPATTITKRFSQTWTSVQLHSEFKKSAVSFATNANDDTIQLAIENGFGAQYAEEIEAWKNRNCMAQQLNEETEAQDIRKATDAVYADGEKYVSLTQRAVTQLIADRYPTLDIGSLHATSTPIPTQLDEPFKQCLDAYPKFTDAWNALTLNKKALNVSTEAFATLKVRILKARAFIEECTVTGRERDAIVDALLNGEDVDEKKQKSFFQKSAEFCRSFLSLGSRYAAPRFRNVDNKTMKCGEFVALLPNLVAIEPRLHEAVSKATSLALSHFKSVIAANSKSLASTLLEEMVEGARVNAHLAAKKRLDDARQRSRQQLIADISSGDTMSALRLTSLAPKEGRQKSKQVYELTGSVTSVVAPALKCQIYPLSYSQHDLQSQTNDSSFIPSPEIDLHKCVAVSLPVDSCILYFQALENKKYLLILERAGRAMVYLEDASTLDATIQGNRPKKEFRYERVGSDLLFAYDEKKRTLAVCNKTELVLYVFSFDETFKNLTGFGGARRFAEWYEEKGISWLHMCFLSGGEAVLLIDSAAHCRIFSLESQVFRPAFIALDRIPLAVFASPDGACMFLTYRQPNSDDILVHAYHWSTFGFAQPSVHYMPGTLGGPLSLTSVGKRSFVHLIGLDLESHSLVSTIFQITTKATEFQFAERGGRKSIADQGHVTVNNCLVDCHGEVWTKFPVSPPIQHNISGDIAPRCLIFASVCNHADFAAHFSALIQQFEASTKKPTNGILRKIKVRAISHQKVVTELLELSVSEFPLGEWLVKLVCLIPIHIAVARDNLFLPMKDGVLSTEWEKSLLGAEVSNIVNSVTFGWYESIFQSYASHKPVKVVSSMGEQSVGKSYCLNHFVDSSFAGNAMRTTEGVWLSCTPTQEALIVALDFEGVQTTERTAQEDTLLVLFNTAISNLVLFRNNFALSRDITNLFQSFQSSSTVLDPAANPSLFQSTLVIIIKDVTAQDTDDIVKEFRSKFDSIVEAEQGSNFISRLHAGQLNIVPWPVIESRDFYTLFRTIGRVLNQKAVTHDAAGEFLLTLKTMMAKLRANDWGAISQTLIAHRAQRLLALLPTALMYGSTELPPDDEPLKNFDTDEPIAVDVNGHVPLHFWLDQPAVPDSESMLAALCQTWPDYKNRNAVNNDWIHSLNSYLQNAVDQRIRLVDAWIRSNTVRFKATHESIAELGREFERLQVDLWASVQLCQLKCAFCHLSCIMNLRHSPNVPHDCRTTHECCETCEYDSEGCGYPAGHSGLHVCHVDAHLCGQPCKLEGMIGCMSECTQNIEHEGDHLCSSKKHLCCEPCALQHAGNGRYTCNGTCMYSSDEMHDVHICDNRLCPISCDLCKRLCNNTNHLHGLEIDAVHLCGQDHLCTALCTAPGICEIDVTPQSVSATFTGRHETFEYTKYSQVAKRLKCAVIIPAGQTEHAGSHIHSTADNPFHFCKEQCKWCGYWCILPLGHPQTLHDTSHGSMSRTRWAIEPGSTLEVNGHTYGTDDDGAPMMCNLFCSDMGRHVHLDFCRADDPRRCGEPDVEHVTEGIRFNPEPEQAKDWVSHSLLWRRTGFKDPYPKEESDNFSKCDMMCPDPEHGFEGAEASYCTLPLFHATQTPHEHVGPGYISQDGHLFTCDQPLKQQAYHIIFVVDTSTSMRQTDRQPLRNTPVSRRLQRYANNRLGAVYSALYSFCRARQSYGTGEFEAVVSSRRDAYSVVLFNGVATRAITNDFDQDADGIVNTLLHHSIGFGTDFTLALDTARDVMLEHWSPDRSPIVVFLSDGEGRLRSGQIQNITEAAIQNGIPLSLHTVAFGSAQSRSTVLRSMAAQALEAQNRGRATIGASTSTIDSSFSEALDTIRLTDTFLTIAESLRRPRGAPMHG